MTVGPVITITNLIKDYQGLRPLRIRDLVVGVGERVAISGLDATAAEVLVNLVNGAILPDEGEVQVFGRATRLIADETEWFATLDRFGIVTPRAVLLEASTARQNLALPFTIDLECLDESTGHRCAELAAEVGLASDTLSQCVHQLSPADRMRIHLARALATNPELLLLEHPTGPLPRDEVSPFARTLKQVAAERGTTVLAITEDTPFADVVATTHLKLQGGTGTLVSARGWRRWM